MSQIIEKPWGHEEILELNDRYCLKILKINGGYRLSLQYHNIKHETLYILTGKWEIVHGSIIETFFPGNFIVILPKVLHRISAIIDTTILEMGTPELNDIIRILDDYGRV